MDNVYKTKDIFEASYLYSENVKFLGLDTGVGFYWFLFSNSYKCEELSKAYWSGVSSCNTKDFVYSFKTLKGLIFSRRSNASG